LSCWGAAPRAHARALTLRHKEVDPPPCPGVLQPNDIIRLNTSCGTAASAGDKTTSKAVFASAISSIAAVYCRSNPLLENKTKSRQGLIYRSIGLNANRAATLARPNLPRAGWRGNISVLKELAGE